MSKTKLSKAQEYKKVRDELFKQLVAVIDGVQIDPKKGVILTPKKKRQIEKYKQTEKKLMESQQVKKPQK